MSDHLKKNLTTQLELLDESSFHLQSSINDYIQQIKTRAMECVDKTPETNLTMKDAITMVAAAQSTLLEQADVLAESTKVYTPKVKIGNKTILDSNHLNPSHFENVSKDAISGESNFETKRRLKDIEIVLTALQDTKQKTEDDISEIKQWRENFVAEQSGIGLKIDNLSKKHKQNYKNLRKQINEKDNKIEELNQQFDSLKTKESDTDKTLEKLSLDIKEYDNNLHTLNEEMKVYTDKTDTLTEEIKRYSDLISAAQEDKASTTRMELSKQVVVCKILQQRLITIDKMIEIINQNKETGKVQLKKIETLETDVLKLKQDFQIIANQEGKHSALGFMASQGRLNKTNYKIKFITIERNVGNHFDTNTGEFTAPVDGLYIASVTIKQTGDRTVLARVEHKSDRVVSLLGGVKTKDKSITASKTCVVWMKTGDVLYSSIWSNDCVCTHFSCFLLDV